MAGNGTRKKQENLSPGEKRRLRQLLLCLALFGAVFLGRGMDLGPVTELSQQVGQLVREDMDVQEVFARMGASFSPWQSQLGLTSCTRLMWKQGRPAQTAAAYSAILRSSISLALSHWE